MKRTIVAAALLAAGLLLVSGCATVNPLVGTAGARGVAGFWWGLLHGMICPIAFVVSLFNHAVGIYEVHNSGGWYNAGFIIGAGAWGILRGSSRTSLRSFKNEELLKEVGARGLHGPGGS